MNLTLTKGRLKGAQTGHSLLAKKRDALTTRFRQILKKVDEVGVHVASLGIVLAIAISTPSRSGPLLTSRLNDSWDECSSLPRSPWPK